MKSLFLKPVNEEYRPRLDLGLGYNWFDYFGCGEYYARWENYPLRDTLYPDLKNTSAWAAIESGMDALNPGWLRFGLPPNPHVGPDGKPRWDTVHIERLKWVNHWAQSRGKTVMLDFFTTPEYYEFPLPPDVGTPHNWLINMAPRNNRGYVQDFVVPFLKRLLDDFGLESIRFFNLVNEPMEYGVFQTPGDQPPAIMAYVDLYRELREALDAEGIDGQRLGLIGMDTIEPLQQLFNMHAHGVDIDPYINVYSVHHYNLRLDHFPPKATPDNPADYFDVGIAGIIEREDREVLRYCRKLGKPLWALEMGSFYNGKFSTPAGVSKFETVFTVAEAMIRASNLGISTFCIWSLFNTDSVDGHWSILRIKEDSCFGNGCAFDLYQMLGKHLRCEAEIWALNPEPETRPRHLYGNWSINSGRPGTLLLIHDNVSESQNVELEIPNSAQWGKGNFKWHICTEGSPEIQTSIGRIPEDRRLKLELPPFSIHLLEFDSAELGNR